MTIGVTVSQIRKLPKKIAHNKEHSIIVIEPGKLSALIMQCDVLYLWNLAYEELETCLQQVDHLPNYIHVARQGKDGFDLSLARKQNIEVSYSTNAFTDSISEFVLSSLFMVSKNLHLSASVLEWKKYPQKQIKNSKALIVGGGSIAQNTAHLLQNNGIEVTVLTRIDIEHFIQTGNFIGIDKSKLLRFHHVICCLPLTPTTEGLVNYNFFSQFHDINFINISRGKVVDTEGLVAALNIGYLSAAVLDAFDEEPLPKSNLLWHDERIVVSAHQAYFTLDWEERLHEIFLKRLNKIMHDTINKQGAIKNARQ